MTSKFFKYAGLAASMLLIAFGIGAIATGIASRGTVHDNLAQEHITGTDDMTPSGIAAAVKGTKLQSIALPTCSVAGKAVQDGASAKCFADYMRIHALEATGGRTYSQMGQFLTASGDETSDKTQAATDPKTGQPTPNAARNVWVTETALSTALKTSYFAESVGLFALIMGVALLLTGVGFLVVTVRWMREPAPTASTTPTAPIVPVPA
jgi:F0F1-type ATP synthase membrane subunit c/vacuolar-type H+-ATPase subunit K